LEISLRIELQVSSEILAFLANLIQLQILVLTSSIIFLELFIICLLPKSMRCFSVGFFPYFIQSIANHSTMQMTQRYAKRSEKRKKDAMDVL